MNLLINDQTDKTQHATNVINLYANTFMHSLSKSERKAWIDAQSELLFGKYTKHPNGTTTEISEPLMCQAFETLISTYEDRLSMVGISIG